jgi:C4-dicarboxylate-specific signal transduction histidine kinase
MKRMTKKMLLGLNRELEQQLKGQENHKLKYEAAKELIVTLKAKLDAEIAAHAETKATLKNAQDELEEIISGSPVPLETQVKTAAEV